MKYIETIKVVDGQIKNLQAHSNRIAQTCGNETDLCRLLGDLANTSGTYRSEPNGTTLTIPPELSQGVVKCRIVYDCDQVYDISFSRYLLPSRSTLSSLKIVECPTLDYHLKYEDRSGINRLMSLRGECDDILITQNGCVSDSSFCNLVFEDNNGLYTPDTPLLRGTARQRLLDNKTIEQRRITVEDIDKYHTIRVINAMIDLEDNIVIDKIVR